MSKAKPFLITAAAAALLAGCAKDGDFDSSGGIAVTRSACPAVAIPAHTSDITVFNPPSSREARAIDVVANITNLRSTCADSGADIVASATFDVQARRTDAQGAREVILPYFATIVQGGRIVVSKRVSRVALRFADGELRASASGQAGGTVNRAAATCLQKFRSASPASAKPATLTLQSIRWPIPKCGRR